MRKAFLQVLSNGGLSFLPAFNEDVAVVLGLWCAHGQWGGEDRGVSGGGAALGDRMEQSEELVGVALCSEIGGRHNRGVIRRYVYHEVVRLEDLEKLMDCSNIQAYTINAAKVLFIKKRPQNRQFKGSGNYCTSCDRSLQEPFIHCSLGCKVDFVLEHYMDLSPFLRVCKTLQLSPDFFIPQDIGDEETTNETPHSTIVDSSNEPMSYSSGSSGSENMSFSCTEVVRKKRSGLYVCGRLANKITEEDMATSMSRRKGVPHRSPLC
ncbi:hypothetical protein BUALT_Bualt16G0077800 [Buddleja alternifolia]|uniref:PLATZ transcription factor family protein n=1 Tax=Buddleja alternifolia TaxID=168488 RepID=A0AAV6WBQ6_9LAMI|nr:hypothetical protein BUALT_Bualt16G0077800 [Buddleja alternifolia]